MLDVGVVGGGLMGMATSYFLLRSGRCRVTLYDASLRRPVTATARARRPSLVVCCTRQRRA